MFKADAILVSDIHLMNSQPKCRKDNFKKTQIRKMKWLKKIQKKYNCPILEAGDLTDKWNPPLKFLSAIGQHIPKMFCVPGNHDLHAHQIEELDKTAYNLLNVFKAIHNIEEEYIELDNMVVYGFPFKKKLKSIKKGLHKKPTVALVHHFVYKGKPPFPGAEGKANELMNKLKGYDLIVTGDNHVPFLLRNKRGQLLVNPGSFIRYKADQIDHKPRVYLWNSKTNKVKKLYVPIQDNVISREHIEEVEKHNKYLTEFKNKLSSKRMVKEIKFEDNMEKYFNHNKIEPEVQKEVLICMEE